jgi:thioredoxin-related protein
MRIFAFALTLILSLTSAVCLKNQPVVAVKDPVIQWITWEQALEKSKTHPRKIMVDLYTDWCGWCKRMDASVFHNNAIVNYVNQNYYAIKFNAEQKEEITFKGKTYRFVKQGMKGYHELAAEITRGRLSYPTIIFLDEKLEVIQPIPGYKEPLEFEQIITYFGRNEHQKTPWDVYQRNYVPLSKN